MVPSEINPARKAAVPTWLVFGALGLAATAGGIFLPRSMRHSSEPPTAAVAAPPLAAPSAKTTDPLEYTPPPLPDLPSPSAMFLRLALGTVFVLILCVLTLWIGKRWIRPLAGPQGENKQLRIIESLTLGGRCSVYLLQAGEARVLAGVDGAGIKALLPLPAEFAGALAEMTGEDG
ncbi:MAG TPA: flagellar biosynthetic protein FliO [Gemmataceae bacterium]|nr:flagellar biosynthetic protein FliO [Gemmataceae bacterium]